MLFVGEGLGFSHSERLFFSGCKKKEWEKKEKQERAVHISEGKRAASSPKERKLDFSQLC